MPFFLKKMLFATAMTAALVANGAVPPPAQARAPAFQPTRFSVTVEGRGPDVILVPGLSSPRDVWAGVRPGLRRHYRLHLVQLRGFGEPAGANAQGPVLEPFVEELAAYIGAHRLRRPALVGHSLGGLAVLMVGARHPGLADKIMVVDALPFIGLLFDPRASAASIAPRAAAMRDSIAAGAAAAPPAFDAPAPDCAAAPAAPAAPGPGGNLSNTPSGRCLIAHWARRSDLGVVARALYDDAVTDLRPELPRIAAPVTLLYPHDDAAITDEHARVIYAAAYAGTPRLRMIGVPGSDHFIMLDQPARFAALLAAFLAGADAR